MKIIFCFYLRLLMMMLLLVFYKWKKKKNDEKRAIANTRLLVRVQKRK